MDAPMGAPAPKVEEKVEAPKPKPAPKVEESKDAPEPEVAKAPEPDLGRIVRYITPQGTVRPAIITAVSDELIDLTVFNSQGAAPATRVAYDEDGEIPGTYHWPKR